MLRKLRFGALGVLAILVLLQAKLDANPECDEGFVFCQYYGLIASYNHTVFQNLEEAWEATGFGQYVCEQAFQGQAIYGSFEVYIRESCYPFDENNSICPIVDVDCYSDGWSR